jgi:hypothetical protein
MKESYIYLPAEWYTSTHCKMNSVKALETIKAHGCNVPHIMSACGVYLS